MHSSEKYILPLSNYTAVRERLEATYKKPTEEDIQRFLRFWNGAYQLWRKNYPEKIDMEKLQHKIKVRKLLNKM